MVPTARRLGDEYRVGLSDRAFMHTLPGSSHINLMMRLPCLRQVNAVALLYYKDFPPVRYQDPLKRFYQKLTAQIPIA